MHMMKNTSNSFDGLDVLDKIATEQYNEYLKLHGGDARAIPAMNLFTVKPDMDGNPN